jgi:hypothetical protein
MHPVRREVKIQKTSKRFYSRVYFPATCFVWLLHCGLFGLGNHASSYIIIRIAPVFLAA